MLPLIDSHTTSWITGVYPSLTDVNEAVKKEEFYLLMDDETLLGTVILNHEAHENFLKLNWQTTSTCSKDHLIIHTLIIDQTRKAQGLGTKMIEHIKHYAKKLTVRSIRLDTAITNSAARRLYEKTGFTYIGQEFLPTFDQKGFDDCVFYEYVLN